MTNNKLTDDRIDSLLQQFDEEGFNDATDAELMAALRELQAYRKADGAEPISFDALNAAVAEVTGCNQHAWNAALYKGHHPVPFINYNSLSRIVEKFRVHPQPVPVATDDGRTDFEAWFKFHYGEQHETVHLLRANGGMNYLDPHVDLAWIAWKDSRSVMLVPSSQEVTP